MTRAYLLFYECDISKSDVSRTIVQLLYPPPKTAFDNGKARRCRDSPGEKFRIKKQRAWKIAEDVNFSV